MKRVWLLFGAIVSIFLIFSFFYFDVIDSDVLNKDESMFSKVVPPEHEPESAATELRTSEGPSKADPDLLISSGTLLNRLDKPQLESGLLKENSKRSPIEAAEKSEWTGFAKIAEFQIVWQGKCLGEKYNQSSKSMISDIKQHFDPEGDFPTSGLTVRWDMAFGLPNRLSALLRANWTGETPARYDISIQSSEGLLLDTKRAPGFVTLEKNISWDDAKLKLAELVKKYKTIIGKANYRRVMMVDRAPEQNEQTEVGNPSQSFFENHANRKIVEGDSNLSVELLNDRLLTYQGDVMSCFSVDRYKVKCNCLP